MATNISAAATSAPQPVKRRVRNYLLDARFQLKFTGYIVLISMAVCTVLGVYLWRNTTALLKETEQAVDARNKAAELSRELGHSALMNQLSERGDDPEFEAQLERESKKIDQAFAAESEAVTKARADLIRRQKIGGLALLGAMSLFILVIAAATIVTTHKVVGPLYRIKRMVSEIADGRFNVPTYPLRDGDELQDLFEVLTRMVHGLRDTHAHDVAALEHALKKAEEANVPEEVMAELRTLTERIKTRLGDPQASGLAAATASKTTRVA